MPKTAFKEYEEYNVSDNITKQIVNTFLLSRLHPIEVVGTYPYNYKIVKENTINNKDINQMYMQDFNSTPFYILEDENKTIIKQIFENLEKSNTIKFDKNAIEDLCYEIEYDRLNVLNKFIEKFVEKIKNTNVNIQVIDSGESIRTLQFKIIPNKRDMNLEEKIGFYSKFSSIRNKADKNYLLWFVNIILDY